MRSKPFLCCPSDVDFSPRKGLSSGHCKNYYRFCNRFWWNFWISVISSSMCDEMVWFIFYRRFLIIVYISHFYFYAGKTSYIYFKIFIFFDISQPLRRFTILSPNMTTGFPFSCSLFDFYLVLVLNSFFCFVDAYDHFQFLRSSYCFL